MSTIGAIFDWAGKKYADHDLEVVVTVVLTAVYMFFMKVLVREGAITKFLTRIHRWHGLTYIMCILTGLVHKFLMKCPEGPEGLCYVMFVFYELAFVALYATEEISYEVSRVLVMFQCGYLVNHMIKSEHSSAIACAVALLACWIVKVLRLAELKNSPS